MLKNQSHGKEDGYKFEEEVDWEKWSEMNSSVLLLLFIEITVSMFFILVEKFKNTKIYEIIKIYKNLLKSIFDFKYSKLKNKL